MIHRFNRYNDNLEKLSKAVGHYLEATQAYSHACVQLTHAFSEFFEGQLDDCTYADSLVDMQARAATNELLDSPSRLAGRRRPRLDQVGAVFA